MIKHFPFQQLGKANHGWLKANHHFSFAHYYHPNRMGFGALRVINDDWVAPGKGFAPHPHNNMEIITFVRSGAITHQDSEHNKGITKNGEVQVMSAGSGIVHSEFNRTKEPLTLYQIWIESNVHNVSPRWDKKQFPNTVSRKGLPLLVSGFPEDKENALFIHQSARIYGGKIAKGASFEHRITNQAYVLASSGQFTLSTANQVTMNKGDGAEVTQSASVKIEALEESEILIIDVPKQ